MSPNYLNKTIPLPPVKRKIPEINELTAELYAILDFENVSSMTNEGLLKMIAIEIQKNQDDLERSCYKNGALLDAIKRRLPHGKFMQWVPKNTSFSYRTANNLIGLYRACLAQPELLVLKKSVIYLLGSKKFPLKLREEIARCVAGGFSITKREAIVLQTRYIKGELSLESNEITLFLNKTRKVHVLDLWKKEWQKILTVLKKYAEQYEGRILRQREMVGHEFQNENTFYWQESMNLLQTAIEGFQGLRDCTIKFVPELISYKSDHDDGRSLQSIREQDVHEDSRHSNDYIQMIGNQLSVEDFEETDDFFSGTSDSIIINLSPEDYCCTSSLSRHYDNYSGITEKQLCIDDFEVLDNNTAESLIEERHFSNII